MPVVKLHRSVTTCPYVQVREPESAEPSSNLNSTASHASFKAAKYQQSIWQSQETNIVFKNVLEELLVSKRTTIGRNRLTTLKRPHCNTDRHRSSLTRHPWRDPYLLDFT
jgi:hypothetical protein